MNANIKVISGGLIGKGLKIGIVASRFNDFLTKELVGGAVDCLVRHGLNEKDIVMAWVPGANELPLAVQQLRSRAASTRSWLSVRWCTGPRRMRT